MRLGIGPLEFGIREGVELARAAEAAGLDSVWSAQPSGYVRLAAYAVNTDRVRLGTAAIVQPLAHPVVHASSARDLAELSGGRAIIGYGSGVKPQLNRFFGIHGDQAEHAAPRMREFLQLLRALLTAEEPVRWEGRFFQMQAGRPAPCEFPVPLYLAAVNLHALRAAGDAADGLIGHPINSVPYLRETVRPVIEERLAARGLTTEDFDFTSDVIAVIDDVPERARRDAAANLGFYLSPRVFDCIFDASGWDEEKGQVREAFRHGTLDDVADAVTDRMLEACCLYGTAAEVRDQLERYEGLLDQVVLFAPRQAVPHERHIANYRSLIETFARSG